MSERYRVIAATDITVMVNRVNPQRVSPGPAISVVTAKRKSAPAAGLPATTVMAAAADVA